MSSVGTMVAAALETAGYRAQQNVLVDLAPLLDGLAMFLFTASCIAGILAMVYGGSYRLAIYFFVGPALFYFFTKNTVLARASDFQFGAFHAPTSQVEEVICGEDERGERICEDDDGRSKVSWVFDTYNQTVSSIIQNTVRMLTDNSLKAQLLFMTRQRIMDRMFDFDIEEPGLKQLIHTGLQEKCHDLMEGARMIALGNRDENYKTSIEYVTALKKYSETARVAQVTFRPGSAGRQYLVDQLAVLRNHPENRAAADIYCPQGQINPLITSSVEPAEVFDNPISCEQLWCFTGIAVVQKAKTYKEHAEKQFVSDYAKTPGSYSSNPNDATLNLVKEIEDELTIKMTPPDRTNLDHLGPPTVTPDASMIPVIIGGILLRKSLSQDPRSEMYSELADHVGYKTKPYTFSLSNGRKETIDTAVKLNNHTMAESLRAEVFTWAMAIPYMQGLLLYALSVLFPFFAVTLVIPGKAHTIVSWMALWAWVKSWDIGWAVVMIADDTIWNLMPHSSVMKILDDPTNGPITVMESAFSGDPAYSLTSYYLLLSMMLYAVPVITAQAVLGSKAALSGMLLSGVKTFGEKVGGTIGDYTSIEQQQDTHRAAEEFRIGATIKALNNLQQNGQGTSQGMTDTFKRGGDMVKKGEGHAGLGKKAMWVAGGAVAIAAVATGVGVVAVGGGLLMAGLTALGVGGSGAGAVYMASRPGAVAGGGKAVRGVGVMEQRAGNNAMARTLSANTDLSYYKTNHTTEEENINALRHAISNRGEFFYPISAQPQAESELMKINLDLDQMEKQAVGTFIGAGAAAARDLITNPVGEAMGVIKAATRK